LLLLIETLRVGLPTGLVSLARIACLLFPLLIVLELATVLGWLEEASAKLAPLCRGLGLPIQAALPLATGLIIGFTYSAGVILASVAKGRWKEHELTRLWILLGLTHALIEDTAIFAAMGLSPCILLTIRVIPTIVIMLGLKYCFHWRSCPKK
jgi:hypothetical protein